MNKKGSEMVEASLVLPIIILTVLSLIMLIIYFYACLETQVRTHHSLIEYADNSQAIFLIKDKKEETSSKVGGIISIIMRRRRDSKIYVINETAVIRIGDFFDDKSEKE